MYNDGEIIRERSKKNFSIIPNEILNSLDLSLRAKGLICWMLSKPDDWVFYKKNIYKGMTEGRDAINKAWAELVLAGYIHSSPVRGENGKMDGYFHKVYDYRVTDNPTVGENNRVTEKPSTGKPDTGKPSTDNRPLLITDINNTDSAIIFNSNELKAGSIKGKGEEKNMPPSCAAPPPIIHDTKQSNGSEPKNEDRQQAGHPSSKKTNATYTEFIRLYDDWFKINNDGIPPKYDGAGGKAAKSMIGYLRGVAKLKSGELPITDQEKDDAALAAWSYILTHWKRIDPFYQEKTRLIDINSNFQNILTQIKNGRKKQTVTNGTTAHDVADAFANIDKHFKDRNSQ